MTINTNIKQKEYSFVLDYNENKLSPTPINNAWYLIRKQEAILVSKYPMIIKLNKEIKDHEEDKSEFVCGIDDGSKYVGIAIVQKCLTKNKVVFKGTINLRQDVNRLMNTRKGYRKLHRQHKRHREVRFNNRSSSKKVGKLAPTIKQKKDSILRVVVKLVKYCNINRIILEDVKIDIRALQDGKLYGSQYQKSNRLNENIRIATLMRDEYKCQECGKKNCRLEAHHIVPKRLKGSNSINNLISLCKICHDKIKGKEENFIKRYQKKINGKNIRFDHAQHVMQGKHYLRKELSNIAPLSLTIGSETANKRIDWDIQKSHSNDAIVISSLKPNTCDIKDWVIKPMRRQSKAKVKQVGCFKHKDYIKYIDKNDNIHIGYINAMYLIRNRISITTSIKSVNMCAIKRCELLWRFNKIHWL